MVTVGCLVTNILQTLFCAQQYKETHTGLEQLESERLITKLSCFG